MNVSNTTGSTFQPGPNIETSLATREVGLGCRKALVVRSGQGRLASKLESSRCGVVKHSTLPPSASGWENILKISISYGPQVVREIERRVEEYFRKPRLSISRSGRPNSFEIGIGLWMAHGIDGFNRYRAFRAIRLGYKEFESILRGWDQDDSLWHRITVRERLRMDPLSCASSQVAAKGSHGDCRGFPPPRRLLLKYGQARHRIHFTVCR
ncbi:uncharacterized protein VTP21DRAFT_4052 [Calcarisporiella thermophila]|uniref:uncharacterized protein n=1 Tax=Calcarisporiella thermophila TaxID=911321 RepID=UPI0037443844